MRLPICGCSNWRVRVAILCRAQYVKPCVFVPIKAEEQLDWRALHRVPGG
jgi:hypothetical protein